MSEQLDPKHEYEVGRAVGREEAADFLMTFAVAFFTQGNDNDAITLRAMADKIKAQAKQIRDAERAAGRGGT